MKSEEMAAVIARGHAKCQQMKNRIKDENNRQTGERHLKRTDYGVNCENNQNELHKCQIDCIIIEMLRTKRLLGLMSIPLLFGQ